MSWLNALLNRITMYRLMLYYLIFLLCVSLILSFSDILPYNPLDILIGAIYLLGACYIFNQIFAYLFRAKPSFDSQFISALIISLILGPKSLPDGIVLLTVTALGAMGSKYLLTFSDHHIFNPAAFGAVTAALILGEGASWWVGDLVMLPFILIGGLIMTYKISRFNLVLGFLATYLIGTIMMALTGGTDAISATITTLSESPILFFSFVMLVEPLTSPLKSRHRLYFGIFTAIVLIAFQTLLPQVTFSLELALLTANIAARLVNKDAQSLLRLIKKEEIAPSIWAFKFDPERPITHTAGQYLEWTVPHSRPDSRGTRRHFTISLSPTEKFILLVTKILTEKSSSFKTALTNLNPDDTTMVGRLEGEFTLPPKLDQPIVFIAGGIGVTPFRSMIKYCLDEKKKYPITLLYSARTPEEFVFGDIFKEAEETMGLRTVYTISEQTLGWSGNVGLIDEAMIKSEIPNYKECLFYVSGPEMMVRAFEKLLSEMGIKKAFIKHDYFPGYSDTYDTK